MNFMGSNINDDAIKKILQIMNSKEGKKIKEELSKMNKEEVLEKINSLKINNKEIENLSEKLNNADTKEILNKIKSNKNFFSK